MVINYYGFNETDLINKIRFDIITKKLPNSEKLTELKLCEMYDVNRNKIRNILQELRAEGLVKFHKNGSKEIIGFSKDDAFNLCDLRSYIEMTTVKKIIEDKNIHYVELARILEDIEQTKLDDKYNISKYDIMFHKKIIGMSHNKYIINVYNDIMATLYTIFYITTNDASNTQTHDEFYDSHINLVKAIISDDDDKCYAIFLKHHDNSLKKALRAIELIENY